jgi:hypothetical protein
VSAAFAACLTVILLRLARDLGDVEFGAGQEDGGMGVVEVRPSGHEDLPVREQGRGLAFAWGRQAAGADPGVDRRDRKKFPGPPISAYRRRGLTVAMSVEPLRTVRDHLSEFVDRAGVVRGRRRCAECGECLPGGFRLTELQQGPPDQTRQRGAPFEEWGVRAGGKAWWLTTSLCPSLTRGSVSNVIQ